MFWLAHSSPFYPGLMNAQQPSLAQLFWRCVRGSFLACTKRDGILDLYLEHGTHTAMRAYFCLYRRKFNRTFRDLCGSAGDRRAVTVCMGITLLPKAMWDDPNLSQRLGWHNLKRRRFPLLKFIHDESAKFPLVNSPVLEGEPEQQELSGLGHWQLSLLHWEVQGTKQAPCPSQSAVWWCGFDGHPASQLLS